MKRKAIVWIALALLGGATLMSACGEETETNSQNRTQQIADSIAKADSLAMIQDSLDALKQMEEMMNEEAQDQLDSL